VELKKKLIKMRERAGGPSVVLCRVGLWVAYYSIPVSPGTGSLLTYSTPPIKAGPARGFTGLRLASTHTAGRKT